jgi:hypothetical protein
VKARGLTLLLSHECPRIPFPISGRCCANFKQFSALTQIWGRRHGRRSSKSFCSSFLRAWNSHRRVDSDSGYPSVCIGQQKHAFRRGTCIRTFDSNVDEALPNFFSSPSYQTTASSLFLTGPDHLTVCSEAPANSLPGCPCSPLFFSFFFFSFRH